MYRIKDWDRWQTYRKDRGQPPWIKLHRVLLRNEQWIDLSDAERGQLVAIWLLAADKDGVIPKPSIIKKLCYFTSPFKIEKFIELGFIDATKETECQTECRTECQPGDANGRECQPGDTMKGSECRPSDQPEKSRVEKNRIDIEVLEIIEDLNAVLGSRYSTTTIQTIALIKLRRKEGYSIDDFKAVHRKMKKTWTGTKYERYLRPETLYSNKFEGYVNDALKKERKTEDAYQRYQRLQAEGRAKGTDSRTLTREANSVSKRGLPSFLKDEDSLTEGGAKETPDGTAKKG